MLLPKHPRTRPHHLHLQRFRLLPLLGAVLKQLLGLYPDMPEAVLKLYEERVNQEKLLSLTKANNFLCITYC
jgi:hypothetical protein